MLIVTYLYYFHPSLITTFTLSKKSKQSKESRQQFSKLPDKCDVENSRASEGGNWELKENVFKIF